MTRLSLMVVLLVGGVCGLLLAACTNSATPPPVVVVSPTGTTEPATATPLPPAAVPDTPTAAAPVVGGTVEPAQTTATAVPRVAVAGGVVDNDTGIAILPVVNLRGDRRYVLQITSRAGSLPFQGSYTRGSIDPRIAIDVVEQIKGATPWEQEIPPPDPASRTWTLGASVSTTLGKNIHMQVWDIGPK